VTEAGLKAAVTPEGRPLADSWTLTAEPEVTAVEIVDVTDLPWAALPEAGLSETEKSLAGGGGGLPALKASVQIGVPSPVGPSQPVPAVQIGAPQGPLVPEVTSLNLSACE